jgi:hypothetical protein
LNSRPRVPETRALARLRYAPTKRVQSARCALKMQPDFAELIVVVWIGWRHEERNGTEKSTSRSNGKMQEENEDPPSLGSFGGLAGGCQRKGGAPGGVRWQQGVRWPVNIGRNACGQGNRWATGTALGPNRFEAQD